MVEMERVAMAVADWEVVATVAVVWAAVVRVESKAVAEAAMVQGLKDGAELAAERAVVGQVARAAGAMAVEGYRVAGMVEVKTVAPGEWQL